MTVWPIYRGAGESHDGMKNLPKEPAWRKFAADPETLDEEDPSSRRRLGKFDQARTASPEEIKMVNAALFLRRPLLVTGAPGTGKSTLAYRVAKELKLGSVLRWPITSRSVLRDGLYHYDPIGRLREERLRQVRDNTGAAGDGPMVVPDSDVGRHLRLGPLGTALLPRAMPRVLLIDEIDKSDLDLPNDLLHVFEEGEFELDELVKLPDEVTEVDVMTADRGGRATVRRGRVVCRAFPFVVMTSNGEREFPPAFLRRCLWLDMPAPDADQLTSIIEAHFGPAAAEEARRRVADFLGRRGQRTDLTTDQLLNAVYLATSGSRQNGRQAASIEEVIDAVLAPRTGTGGT